MLAGAGLIQNWFRCTVLTSFFSALTNTNQNPMQAETKFVLAALYHLPFPGMESNYKSAPR